MQNTKCTNLNDHHPRTVTASAPGHGDRPGLAGPGRPRRGRRVVLTESRLRKIWTNPLVINARLCGAAAGNWGICSNFTGCRGSSEGLGLRWRLQLEVSQIPTHSGRVVSKPGAEVLKNHRPACISSRYAKLARLTGLQVTELRTPCFRAWPRTTVLSSVHPFLLWIFQTWSFKIFRLGPRLVCIIGVKLWHGSWIVSESIIL